MPQGLEPGDPFRFEWQVDVGGYEWIAREGDREGIWSGDEKWMYRRDGRTVLLRGKTGELRRYQPWREYPSLFLELANLHADPGSIVEFTDRFGLLGVSGEPLFAIEEHHEDWIEAWASFTSVLANLGELRANPHARRKFADAFNVEVLRPRFERLLYARYDVSELKRPTLTLHPCSLLTAIWLQAAAAITSKTNYRQCKGPQCATWFAYGPGTKSRETREFCSTRCRVAWHRRHTKEAQR